MYWVARIFVAPFLIYQFWWIIIIIYCALKLLELFYAFYVTTGIMWRQKTELIDLIKEAFSVSNGHCRY